MNEVIEFARMEKGKYTANIWEKLLFSFDYHITIIYSEYNQKEIRFYGFSCSYFFSHVHSTIGVNHPKLLWKLYTNKISRSHFYREFISNNPVDSCIYLFSTQAVVNVVMTQLWIQTFRLIDNLMISKKVIMVGLVPH